MNKRTDMEQIRELISETEEKSFSTGLFGYKKKEILEYLDSLEQNFKNAVYNFEKKISEQSNALTMALREKEKLNEKSKALEEKVAFLSTDVDQHKSELIAENNALKEKIEELTELESKNEKLANEMLGLQTRCEYAENERQKLLDSIEDKEKIISEQCKQNAHSERLLKNEIEKIKSEYESNKKIQQLNIQSLKENLTKLANIVEQL